MDVTRLGPSARSQVPPFAVMTVLDQVQAMRAAGRDVINLCAGEPQRGAPSPVRRRAAEVMQDGTRLGYCEALGLRALRQRLAAHYDAWYGLEIDPRQIAITTGSSGAFVGTFLTAFDVGSRVALARPGYPAYRNILRALGCEVVELDCGAGVRFQPTTELLDAAGPLDGLVLASPANPTGTVITDAEFEAVIGWCREHNTRLISDEIYHGVTFTGSVGTSAWQHDRSAVIVSSFSKYWGMTGWRLGWAVVPDDLLDGFDALSGNYALCPPVPPQYAAIEAFTPAALAECEDAVAEFAAAREVALAAVPALGWVDVAPADGAFYLYANIAPVLGDHPNSTAWCADLLEQHEVAITPGLDFDGVHGDETIRLSLAAGPDAIAEALRRVAAFQGTAGVFQG